MTNTNTFPYHDIIIIRFVRKTNEMYVRGKRQWCKHVKKGEQINCGVSITSSTLLRCLGGAKSSFDFRRLSLRIIRAAANAMLMNFLFPSACETLFILLINLFSSAPTKLLFFMFRVYCRISVTRNQINNWTFVLLSRKILLLGCSTFYITLGIILIDFFSFSFFVIVFRLRNVITALLSLSIVLVLLTLTNF